MEPTDDPEALVRDFKRRSWRMFRWLYVMAMIAYAGAIYSFYRAGEWGNLIQTATIAAAVTFIAWFTRALAKIRGEW